MGNCLETIFLQILNMSITAGYCIAVILLLRLLFRRAPRKYLYALWLVAAFRLLCPVSVSTEFSLFNLERFQGSISESGTGTMEYIPVQVTEERGTEIRTGFERADRLVNQQIPHAAQEWFRLPVKGLVYLAGPYVWLAGILLFLIYFAGSTWKLRRSVRWAVRVGTAEAGTDDVYECDDLSSPFVLGIFHPGIYLPCRLSGEQRRMVLLHEQYHIRRKDHLIKLLAFFLLAVYWFHPLVWAAWFGMCRDMEMSCDEKVLESLGEGHGKEYSMTLLALASEQHGAVRMPLAFGENNVKTRIRHALTFRKPAFWVGSLAAAVLVIALVLLGTNGVSGKVQEEEAVEKSIAEYLYEARNPYVGDMSANGRVMGAIREALPEFAEIKAFKNELQTSAEPYGYTLILEESGGDLQLTEEQEASLESVMPPAATLMLALIDNLGEVRWSYLLEQGGQEIPVTFSWTLENAETFYNIENLKDCGSSVEKVQELLDIMEVNPVLQEFSAEKEPERNVQGQEGE